MLTSIRRRILYIYVLDLIATGLLCAVLATVGPGIAARASRTAEQVAAGALESAAREILRSLIDTLVPRTA